MLVAPHLDLLMALLGFIAELTKQLGDLLLTAPAVRRPPV